MFNITIRAYVHMSNSVGDAYNTSVELTLDDLEKVVQVIRKAMLDDKIDDTFMLKWIEF